MSSSFFLFLPANNNYTALESVNLSWVYEDENNQLKLAQGLLSDAATASTQKNITIVLPGEDVLFLTAEVPGKNIQRIQQAVPYVLEDSVVDDVDDLYFAIKKQNSDNTDNLYNVSVINKTYFSSLINQLEKAGIYADTMIADYFLLDENSSLFFDGDRVVYNSAEMKFSSLIDSAVCLDFDLLKNTEKLKLINCNNNSEQNKKLMGLIDGAEVLELPCDSQPLLCLLEKYSGNNINLLQGSHKKKKNWSKTGKTWLPVSVLFLIWLLVQGGVFVFDYIDLSKQNKLLNAKITKIYKKTFPKSRRIIDAKAQMQQKLSSFRKRKGQSGRSFSEMLANSASVFSKTRGLVIKSLRYYDGRINLEIQISSLQALDKLSEQLNKEKGYQVEIQNASSGKEVVTARLQIIGAES